MLTLSPQPMNRALVPLGEDPLQALFDQRPDSRVLAGCQLLGFGEKRILNLDGRLHTYTHISTTISM